MANQTNQSTGPSAASPGTSPGTPPSNSPDGLKDTYRHLLIPGERYASLMEVVERTEAELQPVGGIEDFLCIDLITNHWRIWRYQAMEAALLNHQIALHGVHSPNRFAAGPAVFAMQTTAGFNGMLLLLNRLEAQARRAYASTLRRLLDFRGRFARYRKDAAIYRDRPGPAAAPTAGPNQTRQNEAPRTDVQSTKEKETPCHPQPDSPPTN